MEENAIRCSSLNSLLAACPTFEYMVSAFPYLPVWLWHSTSCSISRVDSGPYLKTKLATSASKSPRCLVTWRVVVVVVVIFFKISATKPPFPKSD